MLLVLGVYNGYLRKTNKVLDIIYKRVEEINKELSDLGFDINESKEDTDERLSKMTAIERVEYVRKIGNLIARKQELLKLVNQI